MKAENNTRMPLIVHDDGDADALYIVTEDRLENHKGPIAEIGIGYDEPFESEQRQYADDLVHRYNSHDALLAAVECADAYELRDDWRNVLTRHGWDENEQAASVFIRKLRRAALSQSRGEKP